MHASLLDQEQKSRAASRNQGSSPATNDPVYIDVRTPQEFEEVHIPRARNIPLPDLHKFVDELRGIESKSPLLLVCRTQNRAKIAYEFLTNSGLTNCSVLEAGITGWVNEGKPIIQGQKRISLEGQVRAIAGAFILVGVGLGLTVHSGFLLLPTIVGVGLLHAGLTDSCLMGRLLSQLPYNRIRK
ncbi:MAG: rhodanese-like domain-containing protein [Nitrospira sp.]|nr:rhodanese-like domain-containing protein [Nitrospira sp.]